MGIKRIVDTSFWMDSKVEDFTPEDKYFMLYLLTNPFTTQLGIYEISIKQAAFHLGYSPEAVQALIERFENKYGMIAFSKETNEIAIKNFLKHSIVKGGAPVRDCLIKEIKQVKNRALVEKVFAHIKPYPKLNATVKSVIADYEEKHGILRYCNEKENDNDNDNENENENDVSYPVSYHDTYHESYNDSLNRPHPILYGEYKNVVLSDEDLAILKTKLPDSWKDYIERLSRYMEKTGKTYNNHRVTIEDWAAKDAQEQKQKAAAGNSQQAPCSNPFLRIVKQGVNE